MNSKLPGIVVTGASGFIGRNFVEATADKFRLFCLARRSQNEAEIAPHKNIKWFQVDVAKWETLREIVGRIKTSGGSEYVLHLAGYYDFSNKDNPEYERTNVNGTRNILKLAKLLGTRRFLFASSLAACNFPEPGTSVDEDTPPDAEFPYAWSKRLGEEMVKEHSEWFPCAIVRLAAVFSDWCEYPPVYKFLTTWLSQDWNARILGGKGESAVTYIHINDLIKFFLRVIEKSDSLPRISTYNASPNHSTSHLDLFKAAGRYYYGQEVKPIRFPKLLAIPGVAARQYLGALLGHPPFEVLWMMKYIDRKLNVDATRTQRELEWETTPRYDIKRRLLFLIENMKVYQDTWRMRNEAALQRVAERPNLVIHDILVESRDEIVEEIVNHILSPENDSRFSKYAEMEKDTLQWYITLVYQLITTVVRSKDRLLLRDYSQTIAHRRYTEGFDVRMVCDMLLTIGKIISDRLRARPELKDMGQRVYDNISMSFQLVVDEVEDTYERLATKSPEISQAAKGLRFPDTNSDFERIVHQLEEI